MSASQSDTEQPLVIPPPPADRQPLRTNLLNHMQRAGMMLAPLFPYMDAGSIVPAGSLMIGDPNADHGHFYHHNSVDEIIIAFVTNGASLQTGQLYVGTRAHGVNSFLKDEKAPGTYALFSVTQRQFEQGSQPEGISVLCKGCRKKLFEAEFEAGVPAGADELDHPFGSHRGCYEAMQKFNDSEQLRTCPDCGLVSDPFPSESWGWRRYATQAELMCEAKKSLLATAREAAE